VNRRQFFVLTAAVVISPVAVHAASRRRAVIYDDVKAMWLRLWSKSAKNARWIVDPAYPNPRLTKQLRAAMRLVYADEANPQSPQEREASLRAWIEQTYKRHGRYGKGWLGPTRHG